MHVLSMQLVIQHKMFASVQLCLVANVKNIQGRANRNFRLATHSGQALLHFEPQIWGSAQKLFTVTIFIRFTARNFNISKLIKALRHNYF